MKNLLISAFALSLATAAPSALLAQDEHHDQSAPHGAPSGAPDHGTPGGTGDHRDTTMMDHHTTPSTGSTHHTYYRHHTTSHTTINNRTSVHVNVDISTYRKSFDSPNHYHWGDYHAPPGYVYRRWNYGDHLPQAYWARNYWITGYLNFGLVAPPDGYVWVRFGPDALLIDENTGEVIQVGYCVFY